VFFRHPHSEKIKIHLTCIQGFYHKTIFVGDTVHDTLMGKSALEQLVMQFDGVILHE
jgi:phosphoglycolate phosphatase-like HAD superfamily hydrolase